MPPLSGNAITSSDGRQRNMALSTLGALFPNPDDGDRRLRVSRRVCFEPQVFPRTYRTEGHQSAHVLIIGSRQVSRTVELVDASFGEIGLLTAFASRYKRLGPDRQFCVDLANPPNCGSEAPMATADWFDAGIEHSAVGGVN